MLEPDSGLKGDFRTSDLWPLDDWSITWMYMCRHVLLIKIKNEYDDDIGTRVWVRVLILESIAMIVSHDHACAGRIMQIMWSLNYFN